jgi:hypothetical protein
MDIFFTDPSDIPLPPQEVRIRKFEANPWSDGRRVQVRLELTPFQKRPDGEIKIENPDGEVLASVSFIETIDPNMEFTLHLRGAVPRNPMTAKVILFYRVSDDDEDELPVNPKREIADQSTITFEIPPQENG